ncbi:Integrase catalytic domain-containing protein [Aphis craccivora]|uniref:Integrase catalytic domain-containing protein n=1 Tax=Aphis craccivora TaxID=307492 RepID=A0A6G0W1T1_APHCR|nr:Integrase catalytic domain-containing protein [Aphis craccivora]
MSWSMVDPSTFQAPSVKHKEENIEHSVGDSFKINDWYKSYDIDKTYGPKIQANGSVHLGKKEIKLVDNTLTIEDTSYPLTQGLVYWNDPNELVERLKLLLASKAAGNTGVSNEILSIFEELHCFTKFAWATPLKSKTAKEVSSAMSKILFKRSPKLLQLDNGKEFYNSTFDALMKKQHTQIFYIQYYESLFSILPKLINEYNNSKHRTIGMTPVQADADPSTVKIKQRKIINGKIKFNVGDNVRVSTYKGVFAKGYLPSWSTEIFKIVKINETLPTTYQLQDYTGKPIAGCFYSEEILKTNYPNDYLVEKIIPIMSSAILDMQCVLGFSNKYMIKEMSIVDTETWATQHWIFKNSKSMEDNKSCKTNKWLERNYHQLSIEYGDMEYEELGEQKKQVLMDYIPHVALINIEDLGCPRLDLICDDETLPCCIFHMEFNPKQCTFYKVFSIRKWFINNS